MVTGQLEDSLRQEIENHIERRLTSIKKELAEAQNQLNATLTRVVEGEGRVEVDGSLAASILEHLRAAHEEGIDLAAAESSRAKASSVMAIIKAAIEEMRENRSQAEILKTLVNRAASFAPRVAFFVLKGEQVTGWRARGFEGSVGDGAVQQVAFATAADTIVGDVARSKTTWSGGPGSHAEDHLLLNRLGEEPPQRIVAIPLLVRDRTVAVLYADSAGLDSDAINLEALETVVSVSGMAVELLSAARSVTPKSAAEATTESQPQPAYTPTREYDATPAAVEEASFTTDTIGIEAPALQPEPETTQADPTPAPAPEPALAAEPSTPPPLGAPRRFGTESELPVGVGSEEERRLHNDARRFARLLVSEIKLYNEQKVAEGRVQGDLYDRLKEYIDRSREMYDKRVKPEVASRYDYFHQELVNTLGEGDVDKLGSSYPGTTVSA